MHVQIDKHTDKIFLTLVWIIVCSCAFLTIFIQRSKQTYLNHHTSYFYSKVCRNSILLLTVHAHVYYIYLHVAYLPLCFFHPFQRWNFPTNPGASCLARRLSCGRGGKTPAGGSDGFFLFFWGGGKGFVLIFVSVFFEGMFLLGSFTT